MNASIIVSKEFGFICHDRYSFCICLRGIALSKTRYLWCAQIPSVLVAPILPYRSISKFNIPVHQISLKMRSTDT